MLTGLHAIPDLLEALSFDVAESGGVIVAAGDGVAVFSDAHELAIKAASEEEVIEPVVPVWLSALFGDACVTGVVDVDSGFALGFLTEVE